MKVTVSKVLEYPLKGFDPLLRTTPIGLSRTGKIGYDRQWWLEIPAGNPVVVNAKWAIRTKNPNFFRTHTTYSDPFGSVQLTYEPIGEETVTLPKNLPLTATDELAAWFSSALRQNVVLRSNAERGLPDDPGLPSFTMLGEPSAIEMGKWFGLSADEMIRRLRPNVIVKGLQPFQEHSFAGLVLRLGGARIHAAQLCARCTVPGVNPSTGVATPNFMKLFGEEMRPEILKWAGPSFQRDEHGFYATLNTKAIDIPPGTTIKVGQEIDVV